MSQASLFVVDDDALSREFLVEASRTLGYQVRACESAASALEHLENERPDLILTDLRMPGMDGLQLVQAIEERCPGMPTIVVTAHGTVETAVDAMRHGARDFLLKPCSPEALELTLEKVLRNARLQNENAYLRAEASGQHGSTIVAESMRMVELLRSAARISSSKGTVLITGESGTGKERVAQYIHQCSQRSDGPFVRVNCAALSETLLESELFGHERGAFTGAHKSRMGRFELADGGTLLLDEIGEISPQMQAKLLRVLQEEEFERVGGQNSLKVDVRIIASTNRDLAAEVAAGRFREDLYYRLHVLPVHVAPLRERLEDVLPMCEHFAGEYAHKNGVAVPMFSDEARRRLESWTWPGNVRELENVIHRAVVIGKEGRIGPEDLMFGPAAPDAVQAGTPSGALSLHDDDFGRALANNPMSDIERVAILATLESTGGNKTEAARRLGLTARTLSNKMKIWRAAGIVA
tara:strand:+ start:6308 stop:7708 length:1401 start_codon:yes stop_codon:yes gene_type:complete